MAWQSVKHPDNETLDVKWEYNDSPSDPGNAPEKAKKKTAWNLRKANGYELKNGKKEYYQIRRKMA